MYTTEGTNLKKKRKLLLLKKRNVNRKKGMVALFGDYHILTQSRKKIKEYSNSTIRQCPYTPGTPTNDP